MRKTLDQTVEATSGRAAASAEVDSVGDGEDLAGGHGDLLGVAAADEQRAHLVADDPLGDVRANGVDDTGDLEAGDVGLAGGRVVEALSLKGVRAVDARCGDLDADLAGLGLGGVDVGEDEGLRAARLGDGDGLHESQRTTPCQRTINRLREPAR